MLVNWVHAYWDENADGVFQTNELYGAYQANPVQGTGYVSGIDFCLGLDSDGDLISDQDEINIFNTDPLDGDSDGDLIGDGGEVWDILTDPNNVDTDGDSLTDHQEVNELKLNPTDSADASRQLEATRHQVSLMWKQFRGSTLIFTNVPGSPADLKDIYNSYQSLAQEFKSPYVYQ